MGRGCRKLNMKKTRKKDEGWRAGEGEDGIKKHRKGVRGIVGGREGGRF